MPSTWPYYLLLCCLSLIKPCKCYQESKCRFSQGGRRAAQPWPILTLDLGRAVGDGGRPGKQLDGQRGLDAPHQGDGDTRPLHRHNPRHRRHPAPVLEDPEGRAGQGRAGQPRLSPRSLPSGWAGARHPHPSPAPQSPSGWCLTCRRSRPCNSHSRSRSHCRDSQGLISAGNSWSLLPHCLLSSPGHQG